MEGVEYSIIFILILIGQESRGETSAECIVPLGMEEGKIPDGAITASSSYETKSVGPQNARIRQEKNGGAWCPKAQISNNIREYLEVDLTKDHLITWTETQGRFGNGQGQEYAESFFLEYWRNSDWRQYKNLRGDKILRGNSNTYLPERQKLDLPFVASRVRFVPYSQHPRTVCMRVEIYGCIWEQQIIRYSAPKGEAFGPNGCNVEDNSYDGRETEDGIMIDGLGQLTDGIIAEYSETILSNSGSNWIGWTNREIVKLQFQFRDLREFINCTIYHAHHPERQIQIFSSVRIRFSLDGKLYDDEIFHPVIKFPTNNYSIPLRNKLGKFIEIILAVESKWLLVSEIAFDSNDGKLPITIDDPQTTTESPSTTINNRTEPFVYNETIFNESNITPDAFPVNNSQTYIGLVSGALTVIALLLTCTIFLMKQRGRNKVALFQKHPALICSSSTPGITINMKDIKLATPIVVSNGLSQSRLSVKSNSIPEANHVYEKTYKLYSEENLPPIQTPFPIKRSSANKVNQKVYESYYAATDILTIKKRDHPITDTASSLFTCLHIKECMDLADHFHSYNIPHVSRHRLRTMDKLGEGSFGLVHLCEAKGIKNPDLGTVRNRQIVIVRSLWRGVVDSLREDFMKEMYVLATIRDINIGRIIALVEEEPFGAIFEYGELGDLPSFMSNHRDRSSLSQGCLLNFITQVSSGMKYLESLTIPHCDLSARNCTVNQNLMIKISDHAIYCRKYDEQYYVDGSYSKIPLRWMAWEAVLLGKQTCRSDVWSYAITSWEILTNCEEIPYSNFTSEQVLENYSRWYHGTNITDKTQPQLLPQPNNCSIELYRMMIKCWSKNTEDRPTFQDIHLYLKRLGYD